MFFRPFLLLRIAFVQDGKLDYHSLLNFLIVLALLGLLLVWLWQIGLDLVRSPQPMRRVGLGGLCLLGKPAGMVAALLRRR
jgi:hypothetical protein